MTNPSDTKCACTDCTCAVSDANRVSKDGKQYCSDACATGHASGKGCCAGTCNCCG